MIGEPAMGEFIYFLFALYGAWKFANKFVNIDEE